MNDHKETTYYDLTARFLSDMLNPLSIPPLVLLLLGWIASVSTTDLERIAVVSLAFYSVIPLGITYYLFCSGYATSLDFPKRKSRNRLFIYSILSASAGSLMLFHHFHSSHFVIAASAVVFMINPLAGFLINLKWKVSIHAAALASAGSVFLSVLPLSGPGAETFTVVLSLIILLVLLPLMIWARYRLRIHTFTELIGGALAGIIFTLTEISIMMSI